MSVLFTPELRAKFGDQAYLDEVEQYYARLTAAGHIDK
jgi:hypothetical protein